MLKVGAAPGSDGDDSAFTGKDWDEDIGLYYFNARWYDPEIGRFKITFHESILNTKLSINIKQLVVPNSEIGLTSIIVIDTRLSEEK